MGLRTGLRDHVKSNIVGYVALFVAMGGTAAAVTPIITSSDQIAPNVINSGHLQAGAVTAGKIGPAAVSGANLKPSSVPSSALTLDATHAVATSGTFAFTQTSCNSGSVVCEWHSDNEEPVYVSDVPFSVFVDPAGVVHLSGAVCFAARLTAQAPGSGQCASNDNDESGFPVMRLPAGYRPAHNQYFVNGLEGSTNSYIAISVSGNVYVHNASYAILDGISFRNR
jgi:hypothetical protein